MEVEPARLGREWARLQDRLAQWLFRHRGWVPVLPIVGALVWAEPRRPWWMVGVGLMVLGEAMRLWGAAHLGKAARSSRPLAHKLITGGPYAHTRHPLYWGNACLTLGFVLATGAGWPWFVFVAGTAFLGLYCVHARREESALALAFPEGYAVYRAQVPAWRWRLQPAPVEGRGETGRASFGRALRVEVWTVHAEAWLLFLLWLRVRVF
jgi:protein-S-isoprenylcysteine O-methyltransferase Ste14